MNEDPTRIHLQTNVKLGVDPTVQRMTGVATHGNTPFDVPFISQIQGNLWQGGCQSGLHLPQFFNHVISLYPWEAYRVTHNLDSFMTVRMYDSLDQAMAQINAIAEWINVCVDSGPTLVHCQAGLNRSGLVAATALTRREKAPLTGREAIRLLRETRSPAVLCNPAFEAFVLRGQQNDK